MYHHVAHVCTHDMTHLLTLHVAHAHACAHHLWVKHPLKDISQPTKTVAYLYMIFASIFCHVGLFFFLFMHTCCDAFWSMRSRELIVIVDFHLKHGVRGT